jgi:hypothetical protein
LAISHGHIKPTGNGEEWALNGRGHADDEAKGPCTTAAMPTMHRISSTYPAVSAEHKTRASSQHS